MIRNLTQEVEEIVQSTMASHVSVNDEMTFSVATFTETALVFGAKGPNIEQTQCLGIWLMLDTQLERLSTRWSCTIEDWTEETIRESVVKVWDALVVRKMEEDMKRS